MFDAAILSSGKAPTTSAMAESPATDPAALWAEFSPTLRGFLARRVPPGVDADDLVQEVFLRVIRHAGSLWRVDRPEAWLYQIARNALNDALRTRLRRDSRTDTLEGDLPAAPDPAAERAAEAELAPCLTAMIGRLDEPYRTAITLTTLHGVSQAEAARLLGTSSSGMKSRVQRGRHRLREMLVRCCAIALDGRGGVMDFHRRHAGACGETSTSRPMRKTGVFIREAAMDSVTAEEVLMSTNDSTPVRPTSASLLFAAPNLCCGGPAPTGASACCARDAEVKSAGGAGCGCNAALSAPSEAAPPRTGCCA